MGNVLPEVRIYPMPRLQALVYYDSRRNAIRAGPSRACETCGAYPKTATAVESYEQFVRSAAFAWADEHVWWGLPPPPMRPPLPSPVTLIPRVFARRRSSG